MFEMIDRKSQIDALSPQGETIPDFQGNIQFRGVQFAYPSRSNVTILHSLDLDIPADQTTALVGASGSGKSTIFGLLERWYTPSRGSITMDGRPVESLNLQWLRTNIRMVQQAWTKTPNITHDTNFYPGTHLVQRYHLSECCRWSDGHTHGRPPRG